MQGANLPIRGNEGFSSLLKDYSAQLRIEPATIWFLEGHSNAVVLPQLLAYPPDDFLFHQQELVNVTQSLWNCTKGMRRGEKHGIVHCGMTVGGL